MESIVKETIGLLLVFLGIEIIVKQRQKQMPEEDIYIPEDVK